MWSPLQLRRPGWLGQAWENPWTGEWLLVLDNSLTTIEAWQVFIHEWAHALNGVLGHDDSWALAHGVVYRALQDFDVPEQDPNEGS